jgi:hypothetical protein
MKHCKNCGDLRDSQFRVFANGRWSCIKCDHERKEKYARNNIDKVKKFKDDWYRRNRKKILSEQKKLRKEQPELVAKKRAAHYISRKDHIKSRVRKYKNAVKLKVLTHYSNGKPCCKYCGKDNIGYLVLDHINEDGAQHRKSVGINKGNWVYLWIVRYNYPKIFQVLCHNCNIIKSLVHKSHATKPSATKLKVINHYSNSTMQCAECKENDIRVLTIDHMNGGGNKHRRELGMKCGYEFYRWLINQNYPSGYQILCFNCNELRNTIQV